MYYLRLLISMILMSSAFAAVSWKGYTDNQKIYQKEGQPLKMECTATELTITNSPRYEKKQGSEGTQIADATNRLKNFVLGGKPNQYEFTVQDKGAAALDLSLTLKTPKREDNGKYECEMKDPANAERYLTVALEVIVIEDSPDIEITMIDGETNAPFTNNYISPPEDSGQKTFTVKCTVTGKGAMPAFEMTLGGVKIATAVMNETMNWMGDTAGLKTLEFTKTIEGQVTPTSTNNGKTVSCRAYRGSKYGEGNYRATNANILLLEKPALTCPTEPIKANDKEFTFTCTSSLGVTKVTWTLAEKSIPTIMELKADEGKKTVDTNYFLSYRKLTGSDPKIEFNLTFSGDVSDSVTGDFTVAVFNTYLENNGMEAVKADVKVVYTKATKPGNVAASNLPSPTWLLCFFIASLPSYFRPSIANH